LYKVKKKRNWIGHIWCRNCPLRHIIEGKIEGGIEVMVRQGRRRKQLDDVKENKKYWKLKE
jgi:autonomous glycyl radical cofactor GrcA